jgi:hypothetical protein
MEFTIERGKLFMLQTRNGKRTAQAALKIAVDLVNEGMLSKEEAIHKVDPKQLDSLLHPNFEAKSLKLPSPSPRVFLLLPELPPVRFTSPPRMPSMLMRAARSWWCWFALRPLPRISRVCMFHKVSSQPEAA